MSFEKCPNCGYAGVPQNAYQSSVMNEYVCVKDKSVVAMNSDKASLNMQGVEYVRKDLFDKYPNGLPKVAEKKVEAQQQVVPAKPVSTTPVVHDQTVKSTTPVPIAQTAAVSQTPATVAKPPTA